MNEVSKNIKSFEGLESIDVAPLTVHWWSKEAPLAEGDLARELPEGDRRQAESIKAEARRQEYLRSRLAYRRITGWQGALPRSSDGVIEWPAGTVGSITHKDGHVGVALESSAKFRAIGIDAEDVGRMKEAFAPKLASPAESLLLTQLAADTPLSRLTLLTILFSYKESLFKSHYPLGGKMFYFLDAEIQSIEPIDAESGRIQARVLTDTSAFSPAGSVWHGSYRIHAHADRVFVITSAVVNQQ